MEKLYFPHFFVSCISYFNFAKKYVFILLLFNGKVHLKQKKIFPST